MSRRVATCSDTERVLHRAATAAGSGGSGTIQRERAFVCVTIYDATSRFTITDGRDDSSCSSRTVKQYTARLADVDRSVHGHVVSALHGYGGVAVPAGFSAKRIKGPGASRPN